MSTTTKTHLPSPDIRFRQVFDGYRVFSARMYGARSHKNKKLIEGVEQAVSDAAGA